LIVFLRLAEGIDDATWSYHLRRGDYARWFREVIKDPELAEEAARIEKIPHLGPSESRALIRAAIEQNYTDSSQSQPSQSEEEKLPPAGDGTKPSEDKTR